MEHKHKYILLLLKLDVVTTPSYYTYILTHIGTESFLESHLNLFTYLNTENEGQEPVAVKVEICPQLPMSELQEEGNNSAEEEEEENETLESISAEND